MVMVIESDEVGRVLHLAVGEGVSEMRIHFGPGYRLYHTRHGEVTYLLLGGGVKSTQKRDIKAAIALKNALNKD